MKVGQPSAGNRRVCRPHSHTTVMRPQGKARSARVNFLGADAPTEMSLSMVCPDAVCVGRSKETKGKESGKNPGKTWMALSANHRAAAHLLGAHAPSVLRR
jgi:hypothetical protein